MSDPFKDALRKSQKINCCCDTGFVCPTHGAMDKTSDTPETDAHAMDWHRQGMVSTEGGAWVGVYLARRLERQRDEARKENARLRKALQRIADCTDAPDIDPAGEIRFALHCGVEDRDCTDRYDGADYGFVCGTERALEWASNEAKHALTSQTKGEQQ